jgi:hypothetical protein
MKTQNKLWKPETKAKRKAKDRFKPQDYICANCINKSICKGLCPLMVDINGNIPLREPLTSDIMTSQAMATQSDYNVVLAELIEDKQAQYEFISMIPDIRKRAIASMLACDLTKRNIASILKLSYRQIIRISK